MEDVAKIVSGQRGHQNVDVIRGDDKLPESVALAVEMVKRIGDQRFAFC